MTVIEHPAHAQARARGDLAQHLLKDAADLMCLVRDQDRDTILARVDGIDPRLYPHLIVVLAALVPADAMSLDDMLGWVTWDEHGRPLGRRKPECGTPAGWQRHRRLGEPGEECGCHQAALDYWSSRNAVRRQASAGDADAAA